MRAADSYQPRGSSRAANAYDRAFVTWVHTVLAEGYARLKHGDFADSEEEAITGKLVQAMEQWLDDSRTPEWAGLFSVHEDPPVHDEELKGKRRRRVDIRLDYTGTSPRVRFCFEAKRLGSDHGVSIYLGNEGLGRFLDGSYARDCPAAGMLGYVQQGVPAQWATKIAQTIGAPGNPHRLAASGAWRKMAVVRQLDCTYWSAHERLGASRPIGIYHTLLLFN